MTLLVDEWNAAVQHSRDFPTHILGPYEGPDGEMHMECMGGGPDPYERTCNFDTGPAKLLAHDDRCGAVTGGTCDCRDWERFDEDRAEPDDCDCGYGSCYGDCEDDE